MKTTVGLRNVKLLPDSLKELLNRAVADHPASAETQMAFAHGFVFAMDVKDAQELSLTPDYVECDDGWHLAARDLWRELVHYRDDETETTLLETHSAEHLASTAMDDLQNYRLVRYLGAVAPASLEEAYKHTLQLSFFPPTHIWLSGKFINIDDVPEIRVDRQVVFSTSPASAAPPSQDERSSYERFGHLLNATERALFVKMTPQEQDFLLFQLEKQTPAGQARIQPLDLSVTTSWQNARRSSSAENP